jgi:hypothetical protein
MLVADYVFWPAVAFVSAINLYYGPRIKGDRLPMEWGRDGKPTWYAPKAIALWDLLAFMLVVRLIWEAVTYAPAGVIGDIGFLLFSISVAWVHFLIVRTAARASQDTRGLKAVCATKQTHNSFLRRNWCAVCSKDPAQHLCVFLVENIRSKQIGRSAFRLL